MKCPYCSYEESRVIDSRPTDEGVRIRRRRECLKCQKRFTTYEIMESLPIIVIKKDHSRESFDRDKLLNGMLRACEKRPISINDLEHALDDIELTLQNSLDREVSSDKIGELAMEKLKDIDEVAYVRFASVYRQFKDINTFMDELSKLCALEHGKVLSEAKGDILKVKEPVEHALSAPSLTMGDAMRDTSNGYDTTLYYEPIGVCAGIVPFNFPGMIPMGWMVPCCIA